jgi:hypothetical protein
MGKGEKGAKMGKGEKGATVSGGGSTCDEDACARRRDENESAYGTALKGKKRTAKNCAAQRRK